MATPPTPPPPPAPTPKPETVFKIGQTLGHLDQFQIVRELGRGGFGEVYLAYEERAQRHVAIKVMLAKHKHDEKLVKRFRSEYTLGSLLSHPNLVQLTDLAKTTDGIYYIVMEYMDGHTLSDTMTACEKEDGTYGIESTLHLGQQISGALSELHERRIIHRDLKPSNIMIVRDATSPIGVRFKILDFGIAKIVDNSTAKNYNVDNNTSTGVVLGTVKFLGPETYSGRKEQGPETDVYALGCILYRGMCGSYPFGGDSDIEIMIQHKFDMPVPLSEKKRQVPQDVSDLIQSMLAKDLIQRPTMRQVSEFINNKLGVVSPGRMVVHGGTMKLQAVLNDLPTGARMITSSGAIMLDESHTLSAQKEQLVSTSNTSIPPRKFRTLFAVGIIAIVISGIVAISLRSLSLKSARSPSSAVSMAPATVPHVLPDLGVAAGLPERGRDAIGSGMLPSAAERPTTAPAVPSGEKIPAVTKKHKNRKGGLLVHD